MQRELKRIFSICISARIFVLCSKFRQSANESNTPGVTYNFEAFYRLTSYEKIKILLYIAMRTKEKRIFFFIWEEKLGTEKMNSYAFGLLNKTHQHCIIMCF